MSSTPPLPEDGGVKEQNEEDQAAIDGDQSGESSEDVSDRAHQLGLFADSEDGKAVKRELERHFFGNLLDDIEFLYKAEHIFAQILQTWYILWSDEEEMDKQRYIVVALIAADPSNNEAKNDKIFQALNAAMGVLARAEWHSDLHASGRTVWQETLMNITTPLAFFHCEVCNAIREIAAEVEGGLPMLSVIRTRTVAETKARPLHRTSYEVMSNEVKPNPNPSKESISDDRPAAKTTANLRTPATRPPWIRYSIAERIAVFDNFTKPRLNTSPTARTLFHLEQTGMKRSWYALKAQWQEMKRNGITRESLEMGR